MKSLVRQIFCLDKTLSPSKFHCLCKCDNGCILTCIHLCDMCARIHGPTRRCDRLHIILHICAVQTDGDYQTSRARIQSLCHDIWVALCRDLAALRPTIICNYTMELSALVRLYVCMHFSSHICRYVVLLPYMMLSWQRVATQRDATRHGSLITHMRTYHIRNWCTNAPATTMNLCVESRLDERLSHFLVIVYIHKCI